MIELNVEVASNLEVTDNAVSKIQRLQADEGNPELMLRVFVTGGGCSGFSYGFKFDDTQNDDDTRFEKNGVVVLVDAASLPLVNGSTLDFVQDLTGSQFTVNNPNATATCGCGTSFSI